MTDQVVQQNVAVLEAADGEGLLEGITRLDLLEDTVVLDRVVADTDGSQRGEGHEGHEGHP